MMPKTRSGSAHGLVSCRGVLKFRRRGWERAAFVFSSAAHATCGRVWHEIGNGARRSRHSSRRPDPTLRPGQKDRRMRHVRFSHLRFTPAAGSSECGMQTFARASEDGTCPRRFLLVGEAALERSLVNGTWASGASGSRACVNPRRPALSLRAVS